MNRSGRWVLALSVSLGFANAVEIDAAAAEPNGALLYSELGCANCHGGSTVIVPRRGPKLTDLSKRLNHAWVTEFLKDPSSAMPAMFDSIAQTERAKLVGDVVAWLGTQNSKLELTPARHANAERGSALFREIGCLACHDSDTPFPVLKEKTDLVALSDFLSRVDQYRPDGRMPHIEVQSQEAIDIAAHLLDFQASDPREAQRIGKWPTPDEQSITNGKAWFEKLNCAACHAQAPSVKLEIPIASPTSGCLAETPQPGIPHFTLAKNQIAAIQNHLKAPQASADLTLVAMNCSACHDPATETSRHFTGDEALGDAGRFPPPLDGVGSKLQRDWLASVFAGKGAGRVRPYLNTRMPAYPAHASKLADWLERRDAQTDAKPIAAIVDHAAGRKLLGTHGGVGCITCHQWGGTRALGIQAMDLSSLDQRLRPDWFRSYLLNPANYRPGTLMPPLWPGGKSSLPEVLDGDTEKQIGAIWSYIRDRDELPEGFPDRSSGEFELVPSDRPIIQRTFLEGVGTKAILVGFPAGIHLAYDGESARPALLWRGRFFDAYNTWFTRAAPFEKPLGKEMVAFDVTDGTDGHFLGYELDSAGNPTFLSRRGQRVISEQFTAMDRQLIRTLRWEDGGSAPVVAHPLEVERTESGGPGILTFIYSWK